MRHTSRFLAATAITGALAAFQPGLPAFAATPPDTLIQAWAIDDIITLDPAEVFEFTASELIGNSYETLIGYDVKDVSKIFGVVAESWEVSEDGKTIHFKVREGRKFASGNPITASDVVFSLTRAVKLDKSPAFILTQFGFSPENVDAQIVQTGDYTFDFKMDQAYAPSLVLYCLTATVASVVDQKLAMSHEANGDFGYDWLKTGYAGSGPFTIREWRANEVVVMERNDNYSGDAPKIARAIMRHIPEPAAQRLLLEQGDVDIARNLGPEEMEALSSNADIKNQSGVKGSIYYLGLNQKNEFLSKPQVRQAMKYLVDYAAISDTIMKGRTMVHQSFLPKGFLGEIDDTPFALNVAKAKELLAEAGVPDGFSVTMDTRNTADITAMGTAIQQTFGQAGIKLSLIPGDGGQTLTKYRARTHDIYIGQWGADYQDPHTNADTFASNPDNADGASSKTLAWRNAWDIPEMTQRTRAAMLERDTGKRAEMYETLQREQQQDSPFVIMFQQVENVAVRSNVQNFVLGPSFNDNSFKAVTK
ncbi:MULTISPECIES: ABC transporter substrate-binding protein [unclassified Haematobacter]|uniref:ABC transporter substrate-binding protein n=1 Tax=unclassified Haematobacter TaxID=2640585 RepID=UPI0025B80435|nr:MULTISPECIES: ABC transporter substrate-binding protein [unclassified Haematobacter]